MTVSTLGCTLKAALELASDAGAGATEDLVDDLEVHMPVEAEIVERRQEGGNVPGVVDVEHDASRCAGGVVYQAHVVLALRGRVGRVSPPHRVR